MTREERIEKLRHFITCMKCEVSGKYCDDNCSTQYAAGNMGEIIENLEEIAKALEQEPCEDWYDVPSDEMTLGQARQAVKDLRKRLAEHLDQESCVANKKDLSDDEIKKFVEIMKKVPVQVIPTEPCADAISRQAVIEWCGDINMDVYTNEVKEFVLSLPSVTSQPQMGRWIDGKCNRCGEHAPFWSMASTYYKSNYCPNCGAKMEVSE